MGSFYDSMNKGRGSNKGKITPNSNNRDATISITVNVDLRRMAEALAFLLNKGYRDAGSKSGLGRLCIEAVAMSGRKEGIPECETIEDALRYLRENGITWTRDKDKTRLGNLLKFESAHLEGYGTGFDPGSYENKGSFADEVRNHDPDEVNRLLKNVEHMARKKYGSSNQDQENYTNTPSDENMSEAELNARRKEKDQLEQDKMEQTMQMLKQAQYDASRDEDQK